MNLDQIEVFKSVVEKKSFHAAAETLHRAQSAVSYAVKKLEEELGFALFDRSKYRAQLTTQGEAFYRKTHTLFQSMRDLESYAKTLKQGCEPQVRLAVSSLLPLKPVIRSLDQLRWRFPQTEVKLIIDTLGADQLLLKDQADLAITEMRGSESEMDSWELGKLNLIAVTGKTNPLAKKKLKTEIQDLQSTPQIVMRSSALAPERSVGVLNPTNQWSVGDLSSKKELLMAGLGWGSMPEHLIEAELKSGELVQIRKDFESVEIYLSTLKNKNKGPSTQFLWDTFKQSLKL